MVNSSQDPFVWTKPLLLCHTRSQQTYLILGSLCEPSSISDLHPMDSTIPSSDISFQQCEFICSLPKTLPKARILFPD